MFPCCPVGLIRHGAVSNTEGSLLKSMTLEVLGSRLRKRPIPEQDKAWEALDSESRCVPDAFMVGALGGRAGRSLAAEQAQSWK